MHASVSGGWPGGTGGDTGALTSVCFRVKSAYAKVLAEVVISLGESYVLSSANLYTKDCGQT